MLDTIWTVAQYAAYWIVNRFHVFLNVGLIRRIAEPVVWPEMMWAGKVGSGFHDDDD